MNKTPIQMLYSEIELLGDNYLPDDTILTKIRYYMDIEKFTIISAFNSGISSFEEKSHITNGLDYFNSKYDEKY